MPKTTTPEDRPLKDRAYEHVKRMILEEEVPTGGFLSERNLAARLGMSKTPVRLAVARLEHEGFVRVSPQQGIVVVALGFDEILDFIDFRLALETFVVRSLTGKIGVGEIKKLEDCLNEHAKLLGKKGDHREAIVYADMGFHKLLAELKGNQQISHALERQQAMLYRVAMRIMQKHPVRTQQSFEEHQKLVAAIGAGEQNRAAELIESHILRIKTLLIGPSA